MKTQSKNTIQSIKLTKRGAAWSIVSLLLLLFTISSCSSNDEAPASPEIRSVVVRLTLSIQDNTTSSNAKPATRADVDDTWQTDKDREMGNNMENAINPSDLHVVFYNQAGNPVGDVRNISISFAGDNTGDGKTYQVIGNMNLTVADMANDSTFIGKIVVYANSGTPSTGWTQGISNIKDNYTYNFSSSTSYIPMWGTKNISMVIRNGESNNIGDIFLLRAMAKVTVKLRDDMVQRGYTIEGATLNNYANTGYVMPSSYDVASTELLSFDQSFHPNATSLNTGSLNFTMAEGNTSTASLYIPEYNNNESTPSTITIRIKNGDGTVVGDIRTATFTFGNYTTEGLYSSPMNIVRNHHYEFTVYGNPLKINLTVLPWNVFNHTPYEI